MQNLKIGTPVYHYMNMGKVGTIVRIEELQAEARWMTGGTPSVRRVAVVRFSDGTEQTYKFGDLMRADLD